MAMTELDRDFIMLMFGLTECSRAIDHLTKVDDLAIMREELQPGVVAMENLRIFDQIRLGLQMAANTSRLFWPNKNFARGSRLRGIVGLPEDHGLRNRKLRNHIEHLDERLDAWTKESPRPFLTIQLVLPDDYPGPEDMREATIAATAIIYDAKNQTVILFGDSFHLPTLRSYLEDVLDRIGKAFSRIASEPNL